MVNAAAQPKQPDFVELYETLSKEIALNDELVAKVIYQANLLKPFERTHPEEVMPKREPDSVLSKFWEKVSYLQNQNRQLESAVDHLRNLIGS